MPARANKFGVRSYAKHRGVSPALISRWLSEGRLDGAVTRIGNRVCIDFDHADKLLEAYTDPSRGGPAWGSPGYRATASAAEFVARVTQLNSDVMIDLRDALDGAGLTPIDTVRVTQKLAGILFDECDLPTTPRPLWWNADPAALAAAWGKTETTR